MASGGSSLKRLKDDDIDHRMEIVKADAQDMSEESSASMSSDDEDFNPDSEESERPSTKDAKEEYDSDPPDTDMEESQVPS